MNTKMNRIEEVVTTAIAIVGLPLILVVAAVGWNMPDQPPKPDPYAMPLPYSKPLIQQLREEADKPENKAALEAALEAKA